MCAWHAGGSSYLENNKNWRYGILCLKFIQLVLDRTCLGTVIIWRYLLGPLYSTNNLLVKSVKLKKYTAPELKKKSTRWDAEFVIGGFQFVYSSRAARYMIGRLRRNLGGSNRWLPHGSSFLLDKTECTKLGTLVRFV